MGDTKIAWCDKVWNPVSGCTKCATGCKNCYAERYSRRNLAGWKGRDFSDVRCHPERLEQPSHWRAASRIFVNSMGDLFHEDVPAPFTHHVYDMMGVCPQHTFIVLTKRAHRIEPTLYGANGDYYMGGGDYLPNVWLGVSASTQADLDLQVPPLLGCPAAVRVVSLEPLLGAVDLTRYLYATGASISTWRYPSGRIERCSGIGGQMICSKPANEIGLVIVGCESGPHRRPFELDWARSIRDQCEAARVPIFLKQLIVNGKVSHEPSEWPVDLQGLQNFPKVVTPARERE